MLPTYILNKKFLQVFVSLIFCASAVSSVFFSNSLSKNSEYQRFINGQVGYNLLINQELIKIEEKISFLSSKNNTFKKIEESDFSNQNIKLIYYKTQKDNNFKEKVIWRNNFQEDVYLSQIFINASSAIIEASKKFPGKPLYGSVINFPENKMLPIVYTIKTKPNAFETIVIWLQIESFINNINLEFKKRFNLPLDITISENQDQTMAFFVDKMPNLNLVIENTLNTNHAKLLGIKFYYNTLIVAALNVIIAGLLLVLISQAFTRFSLDNFKYLSFWNQEIKNKLLSVREISSSIAHELNQPLAAAEIYVSTLKIELSKNDINREEVKNISNNISQQINRSSNIIKSMNTLSKNSFDEINSYNLLSLLSDLMPLILLQAEEYHSVVKIDVEKNIYISVDRVAFEQIVLNISRNAFQAMNEKEHTDKVLEISANIPNNPKNLFGGNKVTLIFSDNGIGVPRETGNKIFDSFYSDKKDGAGLGLNIVKSLVEQNKGRISFSNNARGGSDFIVHLPMSNIEKAEGNDNIN